MQQTGLATLPLHGGKAPAWLFKRMVKLGKPIFKILCDLEGPDGILERLSDTYWFQSLSCILGFDWHSSGTTTVTTGVLKEILKPEEIGLAIVGGKGKNSLKVQSDLPQEGKKLGYNSDEVELLKETSRLTAKIDNAALQDGFNIYHHAMILSEENWCIVQQGLDPIIKKARRYHWLSKNAGDFLNDPHKGITSEIFKEEALNMVSSESAECRRCSMDVLQEGVSRIKNYVRQIENPHQKTLLDFTGGNGLEISKKLLPHLKMPKSHYLDWNAFSVAKEQSFSSYTDLLTIKGIGPGAIRALALISELIWGTPASWKDPAKYSFAHGGKDGIPYPVNRKLMERNAAILEDAINQAKITSSDRLKALRRLHRHFKLN
jgi:hypothetical protein